SGPQPRKQPPRRRRQPRSRLPDAARGGAYTPSAGIAWNGLRTGRANRAPGRCQAGEGIAWRRSLTGRLVSAVALICLPGSLRFGEQRPYLRPELLARFLLIGRQPGHRLGFAQADQAVVALPATELLLDQVTVPRLATLQPLAVRRQVGPEPLHGLLPPASSFLVIDRIGVCALSAAGQGSRPGGVEAVAAF